MFNGTLIVQGLHFFVGYYLFKHILLKPALQLIQRQEDHERNLNVDIVDLKKMVAERESEKQRTWAACSQRLAQEAPVIEKKMSCSSQPLSGSESPPFSDHEKEQIVKKLAQQCFTYLKKGS